jgi:hypothetical protein
LCQRLSHWYLAIRQFLGKKKTRIQELTIERKREASVIFRPMQRTPISRSKISNGILGALILKPRACVVDTRVGIIDDNPSRACHCAGREVKADERVCRYKTRGNSSMAVTTMRIMKRYQVGSGTSLEETAIST